MISFSQKALQRYDFLRTQPNKMHKNVAFVHKRRKLCIFFFLIHAVFRKIMLNFAKS